MKNCAEQWPEPQITGSNPAICLRVIRPSVPQEGQERTAQYGSSFSPTSPAFSNTNTVPGSICSGIHSLRRLNSPIILSSGPAGEAGLARDPSPHALRFLSPALRLAPIRNGFLTSQDLGPDASNFIAHAYIQHRLSRVLEQIDHLSCGRAQKQIRAICKKVTIAAADRSRQAGPKLLPQKPDHFAHPL